MLLDGAATDGQLMMGLCDVGVGEAPPYHKHPHEDEIYMLIKGTALIWYDDQQYELTEGGVVFLPKQVPHGYPITSKHAHLADDQHPAGIEGMFRATRRHKSTPRPPGFEVKPDPAKRPSSTAMSCSGRRAARADLVPASCNA